MVGFGGGERLLWRAVNIDCCRLDEVNRALQERQLTVTVAVTGAAHLLSAPPYEGPCRPCLGTDLLFPSVFV